MNNNEYYSRENPSPNAYDNNKPKQEQVAITASLLDAGMSNDVNVTHDVEKGTRFTPIKPLNERPSAPRLTRLQEKQNE